MILHINSGGKKTIVWGVAFHDKQEGESEINIHWPEDIEANRATIECDEITGSASLHLKSENAISVDLSDDAMNDDVRLLVADTSAFPDLKSAIEHHKEELNGFEENVEFIQ